MSLGSTPDRAWVVDPAGLGTGEISGQVVSRSFLGSEMFPYSGDDRRTRDVVDSDALNHAAVLFGGPLADAIHSDHRIDIFAMVYEVLDGERDASDFGQLATMAETLENAEAEDFLELAAELALEILTARWGAVIGLGAALADAGEVDRDGLLSWSAS